MMQFLIFCLVLYNTNAESTSTPVFLTDYDNEFSHIYVEPNPFAKMTTSEYESILTDVSNKSKVILIFIEDSFCVEDISTRDMQGSPFIYLSKGIRNRSVHFFPSVMQPYKSLIKIFPTHDENVFHIGNTNTMQRIYDERFQYYYIYFKDGHDESRVKALRRHDNIMHELYIRMRHLVSGPVITFYTGKMNPILLDKMNFVPIPLDKDRERPGVTISSYGAMFHFVGLFTSAGHRRVLFTQTPTVTEEIWQPQSLKTRMGYADFELEFSFFFENEGWLVDSVALLELGEEVGRTKVEAGAPWNSSFICSEPLVLINTRDASAITISQYQVQPFQFDNILRNASDESGATKKKFGPAVNCAPYFTSQILAGLMVTFFCLGILTYGVITMYNCHSNDRYDDPQGKPLVIAADPH